jgi:hypothetical protein
MQPPQQAKITRRLVTRTLIGLLALAILLYGYQWLRAQKNDPDFGSINSVDAIVAVEQVADGSQVVYFAADGKIHRSPDRPAGSTQKDPIWRTDGNRIFYSDDRKDEIFQIFRWNPAMNQTTNRSSGRISRTKPQVDPFEDKDTIFLLESGLGYRLDVKSGKSTRVFPPIDQQRNESEDANSSEMKPKGSGSFDYGLAEQYRLTKARWVSPNWLVGIRRLDDSDSLILQSTDLKNGLRQPYAVIFTGRSLNFDVEPKTGTIVCAINGFRFNEGETIPPQFLDAKTNRVKMPFKNALIFTTIENILTKKFDVISASKDDKQAFGDLAISPDASGLAISVGTPDSNDSLKPQGLVYINLKSPKDQPLRLAAGEAFEPSWSSDGSQIVFTMRDGRGNRPIYTVAREGGEPRRVSPETGIFMQPSFSPQVK